MYCYDCFFLSLLSVLCLFLLLLVLLIGFCSQEVNFELSNTTTSVNITSPLFPKPYPNDMKCTWSVSNSHTSFIRVTLTEVELGPVDELHLVAGTDTNSGNNVMTMKNSNGYPNSITINSTAMWVSFVSDQSERAKGFFMTIQTADQFGKYIIVFIMLYLKNSLFRFLR